MTSKILIDRELLERATDNKYVDKERISIYRHEALCAIRAALAADMANRIKSAACIECASSPCICKEIAAPEAPRQEPVAWGDLDADTCDEDRMLITDKEAAEVYDRQCYALTPLYAAPLSPDHYGGGAGVVAAQSFAKGFNTFEQVGGEYKIVMEFAGRDDAWAAYNALCKLTDGHH